MTCALGVPMSRLKAFLAQGAYLYKFQGLPAAIVEVLDAHFAQVDRTSRPRLRQLRPRSSPNSSWLRGDPRRSLCSNANERLRSSTSKRLKIRNCQRARLRCPAAATIALARNRFDNGGAHNQILFDWRHATTPLNKESLNKDSASH